MRVDVHSLGQVEALEPRPGTVVISITSPGRRPANLRPGWSAVLRLEFDDVIKRHPQVPSLVLFSQDHVDTIHSFVEEHLDKDFVIHCEAGVSRSVAVGLYLHDVHGAELHTHAIHTTAAANSRVHRGLIRGSWIARLQERKP